MEEQESLTVDQAAAKLNCSSRTVYRLIQRRAIPFVKLGYRTIRLPVRGINDFIQTGGKAKLSKPRANWKPNMTCHPAELSAAYWDFMRYIERGGDRVVSCVLHFRTAQGKIIGVQVRLPSSVDSELASLSQAEKDRLMHD